ncbi:TauD/TfdA family dioxygenase [Gandjariella thermophila]|uniref:TauD/TfdA-like domain-containing protein n=1 Tax=Gandjariella thermophila TaxID=1931992 RepID=A0A4D4JHF0_9PSEU|nr:TauD/TfdA family dioxygenase [Gandjariella thermophila]GDY33816.1 hypothetical protein GTS_54490 [Gandjariella thermophila]
MDPLHVIALDRDLHPELLKRIIPDGHPLTDWPTEPPTPPTIELAAAARAVADSILREPGYAVVDTQAAELTDTELVSAAWNLFTVLCVPVPQYLTGELIYPVEVTAATGPGISHYSTSNAAGGFHTDGTMLDQPPAVAALLCVSPADEGGETLLMDGLRLISDLTPEHRLALTRPFWFHSGDPGSPLRHQPILNGTELRYLRRYIEEGHRQAGAELSTTALDALDRLSELPDRQRPVPLRRAQVLLWDNTRFIHGRRPFTENTSRRRLRRMYGTPRDLSV